MVPGHHPPKAGTELQGPLDKGDEDSGGLPSADLCMHQCGHSSGGERQGEALGF